MCPERRLHQHECVFMGVKIIRNKVICAFRGYRDEINFDRDIDYRAWWIDSLLKGHQIIAWFNMDEPATYDGD